MRSELRSSGPTRDGRMVASGVVVVAGLLAGCVQERVVYNHPFLSGLPGSTTSMATTPPAGLRPISPEEVSSRPIKVDNADGSVTLRSGSPRHLMIHIHNLLLDKPVAKAAAPETPAAPDPGETVTLPAPAKASDRAGRPVFETQSAQIATAQTNEQIFTEQILSTMTRDEFAERGVAASEAYTWCKDARDDIEDLFAAMPMAESTPGIYFEKIGDRVYRMRLPRKLAEGLRFSGMDMVLERGSWKLRWFVE